MNGVDEVGGDDEDGVDDVEKYEDEASDGWRDMGWRRSFGRSFQRCGDA
jgi:hypothetical protein